MVLRLLRGDAILEYWQGVFEPKITVIRSEGRGWGKAPHKDGQQPTGEINKDSIGLYLSDKPYVDTAGKTGTLICGCDPKKAAGHRFRDWKYGKAGKKCVPCLHADVQ